MRRSPTFLLGSASICGWNTSGDRPCGVHGSTAAAQSAALNQCRTLARVVDDDSMGCHLGAGPTPQPQRREPLLGDLRISACVAVWSRNGAVDGCVGWITPRDTDSGWRRRTDTVMATTTEEVDVMGSHCSASARSGVPLRRYGRPHHRGWASGPGGVNDAPSCAEPRVHRDAVRASGGLDRLTPGEKQTCR